MAVFRSTASAYSKAEYEVAVGLGSYLQNYEYYQSDGRYVLSEATAGIGFILDVNVAL
jgi:hypothetical protein